MTQTVSAVVVLGPGLTGLALGYRVLNLDGMPYSAFTVVGVAETAVAGTYQVNDGVVVPVAGGYIVFGTALVDYAVAPVDEAPAVPGDAMTLEPAERTTLAGVVWAFATRTLTSLGSLAADVWSYATRTLTQSALSTSAPCRDGAITALRGDTASFSLTGLGSLVGRSDLWFTVKTSTALTDAQSTIQITEAGGLLYLNGGTTTPAWGSITVNNEAAGNITIVIEEDATRLLEPRSYHYDIQVKIGSVVTTLVSGAFLVVADVTRTI